MKIPGVYSIRARAFELVQPNSWATYANPYPSTRTCTHILLVPFCSWNPTVNNNRYHKEYWHTDTTITDTILAAALGGGGAYLFPLSRATKCALSLYLDTLSHGDCVLHFTQTALKNALSDSAQSWPSRGPVILHPALCNSINHIHGISSVVRISRGWRVGTRYGVATQWCSCKQESRTTAAVISMVTSGKCSSSRQRVRVANWPSWKLLQEVVEAQDIEYAGLIPRELAGNGRVSDGSIVKSKIIDAGI